MLSVLSEILHPSEQQRGLSARGVVASEGSVFSVLVRFAVVRRRFGPEVSSSLAFELGYSRLLRPEKTIGKKSAHLSHSRCLKHFV